MVKQLINFQITLTSKTQVRIFIISSIPHSISMGHHLRGDIIQKLTPPTCFQVMRYKFTELFSVAPILQLPLVDYSATRVLQSLKTVDSGKNSVMLCFLLRHNFNRSLCKNILLVIFHSLPLPLDRAPPQLTLYPSPTNFNLCQFPSASPSTEAPFA